jgi:chorismate mutase/prephenate dehydratase
MDLRDIRGRIDEVDEQLVRLLCERMRLVALAGTVKWRQGLPISDTAREQEISERTARLAGREFAPYARRFFSALFSISKDYQVQRAATDRWPEHSK